MRKRWKRWLAGLMTAVMLMGTLPTAAYAALWDNTPDQNKEILRELTAFWGDEKTAKEAMELLRQYGLIDEDGNVLTDWSGEITIQEESRPLTIAEARALSGGDVTVNSRPCAVSELKAALDGLETLGLLADNTPVTNWQLQVDGQDVAPAALEAVLESWTAPTVPEEETPAEPETPEEPEPETPELPQNGGAGSPEQSGGLLASVGRFFGVGASAQAPAAPVVTVLGQTVDSGDVLEVIAFLDQYGLLTDAGCAADWGLTLPGGERKTDLTELLSMLEKGDYDPDMVIRVDGTPVTMADFKTMMEIQKEVERIQSTYFPEGGVEWTEEELGSLYDLYQQLQANGIQLYNTQGADDLVFPSGADQSQRVFLPSSVTVQNGGTADLSVSLAHAAKEPVTLNWKIAEGSAAGTIGGQTSGTLTFDVGNQSQTLTVQAENSDERWNGNRAFVVEFSVADGALFDNESACGYTTVLVHSDYTYPELNRDAIGQAGGQEFDLIYYPYESSQETPVEIENFMFKNGTGFGEFENFENPPWLILTVNNSKGHQVQYTKIRSNADYIYDNGYTLLAQTGLEENKPVNQIGIEIIRKSFYDCNLITFDYVYDDQILPLVQDGIATKFGFQRAGTDTYAAESVDVTVNEQSLVSWENPHYLPEKVDLTPYLNLISTDRTEDHLRFDINIRITNDLASADRLVLESPYLLDDAKPRVVEVTAPAGSYRYGQVVPITVEFSEPVESKNLTLTANGQTLSAVDTGDGAFGYRQTFLYEVPKSGSQRLAVTEISGGVDLCGKSMEAYTRDSDQADSQISGVTLDVPELLTAVNTPTPSASVVDLKYSKNDATGEEKTTAVVEIILNLPKEQDLRDLIIGSYPLDNGSFANSKLAATMDNGQTLLPLVYDNGDAPTKMTATVEIDVRELLGLGTEEKAKTFTVEFYLTDEVRDDQGAVTGVTARELLFGRYAAFSVNKPVPLTGDDLTVSTPEGWLDTIYVNDPPEDAKLTLGKTVNSDGCTWSQIRWVSSNDAVATIDPVTGVIHPLANGTVEFWLEAVNGGLEEYQGSEYQSEHIKLIIQEGANPYLRIPEQEITLRAGDPLTLRWASNLAQKNSEYGADAESRKTTFTIKVYQGEDIESQPVKTYTVTYDPATPDDTITMGDGTTLPMWTKDESDALTPNQSFVIPELTDTGVGYTITITAQAGENVPSVDQGKNPDGLFTAQTRVTVTARPVSVSLTRPDTLFKVNEGSLTIPYTLTDFDAVGGGADFKLVVTDNSTGEKVLETTDYTENGGTTEGGQFTIDLSDAEINDGFRTIYDVTLQAKNTTAGQDWSRDSFTLYIYDKNALDILVQPVERGGVTTVGVNGDSVTMSNEDWIASLSQDEILALNRDIDLQTAISINYGDHAWGEASDRIRWAVENSETAAVNYPQGAYYENIEGLPYSSYAPATQFLLSGKNSGKTVVEAIHDLAGDSLSSSVEVTVETLKDKLYLFQFYPAAPGLTMTYTNGAGEEKNATSDSQGRFAIYEASGIASDVYVQGTVDGELYLGTVYQDTLVSQEKDAVSLELYPLNSLELRKAATLPLYLKTPEGKDYDGEATVRVGVYRNGVYCPDAKYALKSGEEATIPGTEDKKVTFQGGKATFYFDVTQFNTNNGADPITAADDIEFVVEIRTPVIRKGADTPAGQEKKNGLPLQYYPVLFSAMGTTNEEDAIKLGERIVNLEQAPNKTVPYRNADSKETIEVLDESPFIARSILYFTGQESGLSADVRGKKGKIGPSADYPNQLLSTCVFWWGDSGEAADPNGARHPSYRDDRGNELTGQVLDNNRYPFTSIPVSKVTVPMNKTQLDHLGLDDLQGRGIKLRYVDHNNTTMKEETMPWSFMNALNLEKATDSDSLEQLLDNMAQITQSAGSDGIEGSVNDFVALGITLATKSGIDLPILKMQLAPTGDPTVFRGLVYIGLNNIENDNVTGIAADTSRGYDVDYFPGFEQIKGLYNQGTEYGKTMGNQLKSAGNTLKNNINQGSGTSKTKDGKIFYALNGGFETEVYYDFTDQEWKMVVVNGNFEAGGGYGMEWTWNTQVGPVPVLAQLELGASAVVHFDAAVNRQVMDNDYLTQLSIYAYLQAFGGIGFDYAVVALKLGLFGQIGLDAQLKWLNAIGQDAQFGYDVGLEGTIGMKFQVEVLFISYEKILWSQPIANYNWQSSNWGDIDAYWDEAGKGNSGAGIITPDNAQVSRLMTAGDTGVYAADLEPKLLDRDYLSQYERTYDSSGPEGGFNLFNAIGDLFTGGEEDSAIGTAVIDNSYPQAAPVLSDDGAWLFYLDDMGDGSDATKVRVNAAPRSGEGYQAQGAQALSDEGYGDSGLRAAGSGDSAVAVWSRVTERPATTEAGSSITADVQAGMMNSSEIVVAVRSGDSWNVSYLTGNKNEDGNFESSDGLADLSPVVATNGKRILVAWRQVASSEADEITTFDAKDYIMYAVSEDKGETWTEPQPIYNGTSGSVKGIEAAMLDSGEAAVVFTLQTGEHDTRSGDFKQEVAYAIIDEANQEDAELLADGTTAEYQVKRYVQMTDDDAMDENPQIAAVQLRDDDAAESFVIGWSSTSGTGAEQENDIKLAAVDANGNRVTGFVDSLSSLIANTGVRANADFRFSRNADTLDDLSILWKESAVSGEEITKETTAENSAPANYDYLSGLRFRTDNGNISVTAAQRIAQMGKWTVIDNFDAYVNDDGKLLSVLQGTYYDYDTLKEITVTEGTNPYTVYLPQEKTSIYLGSGTYTDTLRVDSVLPDYQNIKKGMSIPVQISVTNLGTQPMSSVTVKIGKDSETFTAGTDGFVAVAPGETRALTVFYTVTDTNGQIDNPTYTITGTFQGGSSSEAKGTLTLNIPDLGIAGSETLLQAQDGQRVLQFTLYNNSDAELADSGRTVKFNLYSDPECAQPIPAQYFQEIVTLAGGADALKTINGEELAKIDEGYYTVQYRFNLAEYIQQVEDNETPYADENGEVRDGGITLYAKAWVEVTDENGTGEMLECIDTNNIVPIHLESLLKQADGEHVTISQGLAKNGSGTTVDVTLNNNSIVNSETGNVVVWLYDENGNVVDVQQSYTTAADLITLAPEERKMMTFTFDKPGVRAEVSYGDLVLEGDDPTLTALSFSGLATLPDFVKQEDGNYAASVKVSQVSSTVITATAKDLNAKITINGQPLSLKGMTLDLSRGENVLTVEVVSGSEKLTYTLTVQNDWPSSGSSGSSSVSHAIDVPEDTEHGTVTVSPEKAKSGQTVTITAKPDEGYQVGKVTVIKSNGDTVKVTDKGNGVYTFTMPNSKVSVDVTFAPEGQWTNPFVDVAEDAWYYDAVQYVNENGLMAGTSANTFAPDRTTTRGMIVTILYRLEGSPDIENEIWGYPFKDVDANAYYATAVYWARMNGIVAGYSDELFGPDDIITREQMATILYRYAQYKGYDTTAKADLSRYTDAAQVGSYAVDAIRWANAEGLVNGTSATTLTPKGSATRAQVAVILTRFCQNVSK